MSYPIHLDTANIYNNSTHTNEVIRENPALNEMDLSLEDATGALDKLYKKSVGAGPAEMAIRLIHEIEENEGRKIHEITKDLKKKLETTNLLLKLQSEFTSLPDLDRHRPSENMKKMLIELRDQGIEIWDENAEIVKEKIPEIKAQINAQVEKLRTEHQTIMTTDLQHKTNSIQAFLNIARQIVNSYERSIENILKRIHS